jgi:HD-GYP domain-containing protein (c-di-GMP phosphodiesterase class II)
MMPSAGKSSVRPDLAFAAVMDRRAPLALAALAGAGGALAYRGRRAENAMERLAAAALETLLNAIEANDEVTGSHVRRVAATALIIADAAGLDEHCRNTVERVALFHDIGKIHEALFDIVHDTTRLTPEQRREIATHPRRGAEVLSPLSAFYPDLAEGVLSHHERWDGKGYPRKLRGRRIPLAARVVTIADTFDAVSHSRRYRAGRGVERALEVLAEGRGTQFDPELVDLVLLPPVSDAMARVRVVRGSASRGNRKSGSQTVPDIAFRWRSESLRARRIKASRHPD